MKVRLVRGYRGHCNRLFQKGPNWFQITVPPSQRKYRWSLIVAWPSKHWRTK